MFDWMEANGAVNPQRASLRVSDEVQIPNFVRQSRLSSSTKSLIKQVEVSETRSLSMSGSMLDGLGEGSNYFAPGSVRSSGNFYLKDGFTSRFNS